MSIIFVRIWALSLLGNCLVEANQEKDKLLLNLIVYQRKKGVVTYRHDSDDVSSVLLPINEHDKLVCFCYKDIYGAIIDSTSQYSIWTHYVIDSQQAKQLYTLLIKQFTPIMLN